MGSAPERHAAGRDLPTVREKARDLPEAWPGKSRE